MGQLTSSPPEDSATENPPITRRRHGLIRSFYFPIGSYAANLELLRADRAKYERLVDATADLDGLSDLFQSFAQAKNLKPLMLPI